jgi:hypothetical protein
MLLLEVILRLTDPLGVEYFSELERYFATHINKENYSYIHPPEMDEIFQGVKIKTNTYGLRGPEFQRSKPEGKKRILILGDSVVLGWGVEYEDTFPSLIQSVLSTEKKIEVIPAGVSSWNTRTEYEYFKAEAVNFDPDILVLIIVSNDTDPKKNSNIEIGREELEKMAYKPNTDQDIFRKTWFSLVDISYLFRHLQFVVKVMTEKDHADVKGRDDLTWKDTELALDKMIGLCRSKGIKFKPFLFTDKFSAEQHPIYSMYSEYFKENGIEFFTFDGSLFEGYKYKNSVIDNHPDEKGHKIIAQKMLKVLEEK